MTPRASNSDTRRESAVQDGETCRATRADLCAIPPAGPLAIGDDLPGKPKRHNDGLVLGRRWNPCRSSLMGCCLRSLAQFTFRKHELQRNLEPRSNMRPSRPFCLMTTSAQRGDNLTMRSGEFRCQTRVTLPGRMERDLRASSNHTQGGINVAFPWICPHPEGRGPSLKRLTHGQSTNEAWAARRLNDVFHSSRAPRIRSAVVDSAHLSFALGLSARLDQIIDNG